MKRNFFANISLLIFLNIIVKAFWVLGIDRSVQNIVGAEEYGFYFSLLSFSVLFNIFLDFGITNYNNRRIASSPTELSSIFANIFVIRIGFVGIYILVALISAHGIGYTGRQLEMLYLLMLNQGLISFILFLRSNITALHLFKVDSVISVLDRFVVIVICSILLWGGILNQPFRIEWLVYSQTVAYGITFLISLVLVLSRGKVKKLEFNSNEIVKILRDSFPFALLALFMTVYWRIDSVMIERLLPGGSSKTGIYAMAFRLLDAAAMIPFLFTIILLPLFSRALSIKDPVSPVLKFSSFLLLMPALATTAISVIYPEEIMDLLYKEHIRESAAVFRLLMAGYIPVSIVYIYGTLLTAMGKLKLMAGFAAIAMVLDVILNLVLIPKYGIIGSAISSIITHSLLAVFYILIISKSRIIDSYNKHLIKLFRYAGLFIILIIGLNILGISILPGTIICIVVAVVYPLLTRDILLSDLSLFFEEKVRK